MPNLRHIHKGDNIDLYLCVPVCKTSVSKENTVYKIVDYYGTPLRICTSTGLPMSRKDMVAIPDIYPQESITNLYKQLKCIRLSDLQSLSPKDLYIIESVINKVKA